MGQLGASLADQTERAFVFIQRAIEQSDKATWVGPNGGLKGIWQHVLHMIECYDWYVAHVTEPPSEAYNGPVDWEDASATPPEPSALATVASAVSQRLADSLRTTSDEALLQPESACPWTGETLLDRVIYALRHTTWHIGEVNAILKLAGRPVVVQDR